MESIYLGIVIFLFLLAIFDLTVGVSNDAVNFLNSAIGAKAASFKTIILIAAAGIFCGATMSNGMMEIARHGIFRPEAFHFNELMCIFLGGHGDRCGVAGYLQYLGDADIDDCLDGI